MMHFDRIVVVGAGAVGGVIAGYLAEAGHSVVLVEKDDAHRNAIENDGVRFRTFTSDEVLRIPVVAACYEIDFTEGDAVIVAVKSFDSDEAYGALAAAGGRSLHVFSAQNGIGNDDLVASYFDQAHGIVVLFNGTLLAPGDVAQTLDGLNEIGTYPEGVGEAAAALVATLERTRLKIKATNHLSIMRWNKLLLNLSNPVSALTGKPSQEVKGDAEIRAFIAEVYGEGQRVLDAAGIVYSEDGESGGFEDRLRQITDPRFVLEPPSDPAFNGYVSMAQDLMRRSGRTELDWLTGVIIELGAANGVPTPLNAMLYDLVQAAAEARAGIGTHSVSQLRAEAARRSAFAS
jgi:2-dehydropantoate 2-reductase